MRHGRKVESALMAVLAVLFVATEALGAFVPSSRVGLVSPLSVRPFAEDAEPDLDDTQRSLKVAVALVPSAGQLRDLFADTAFDLAKVRTGVAAVPPLFLAALPGDLRAVKRVEDRKGLFARIVLPLILHRNAVVAERRRRLTQLDYHTLAELPEHDRNWLVRLARLYRVLGPDDPPDSFDETMRAELLRRVDVVPPSLALAQAAAESGWGTSRFARRGNALFGQWTWDEDAGIIPGAREEGREHAVRAFARLSNSVRAYVHNLNISHHYEDFRKARAALRRAGDPDGTWGHDLAGHLDAYSEEGAEYIRKIRLIIRANDYGDFETALLANRPEPPARGS